MKMMGLICVLAALAGCGTVNSVARNDVSIAHSLRQGGTRCTTLPRVYGGIAYDICKLHSDPKSGYYNWFLGFYLLDVVPSAVADTVVLPYSLYAQSKNGQVDL